MKITSDYMINKEIWDECVEFHGHECPGLAIGYRAALYVQDLLKINFSEDEEVVCISENDSCSIDAIQVITGCTAGKGNLKFHMTGKHAYSFYDRKNDTSVRLVLKKMDRTMTREETFDYVHNSKAEDLFDVKEPNLEIPQRASIYDNVTCSNCGEETAEAFITVYEGKPYCKDCLEKIKD